MERMVYANSKIRTKGRKLNTSNSQPSINFNCPGIKIPLSKIKPSRSKILNIKVKNLFGQQKSLKKPSKTSKASAALPF